MNYYEVLPRDPSYRLTKSLSYAYAKNLSRGHLVKIPLKQKSVVGIVMAKVSKPAFDSKEIIEDYSYLPPLAEEMLDLLLWIQDYYPGSGGATLAQFTPSSIPSQTKNPITPKLSTPNKKSLPTLSDEQQNVLTKITDGQSYLLHGDTGTGKTRIYLELAVQSVIKNKSVLILTPEISLTSQLAADFKKVFFKDRVIVIHSMLSAKERHNQWLRILLSKQPLVVLGPRSALFSPFKNLGLVVVDESHENAYKQEQSPKYHAVRVASKLASLYRATFVIGSATPSIVDYFVAEQKHVPILTMHKLAINHLTAKPEVTIVDLTDRSSATIQPYLSQPLIEAVSKTIAKKEQVLLFLNRRGTARVIFCDNCGWQATCPRCDLPLIYHGDSHSMQCHTCGFKQSAISSCPVCHQEQIIFKGMGTKAITGAIQKLFPSSRVQRFDNDNSKSERLEQHYEAVKSGQVDILVGTQTLGKGLDLPRLGLVGVIVADTSLFFPDFAADEATFQLLTQVLGRVGRGHRAGQVVIQTYNPSNRILKAAVDRDWTGFYSSELSERKKFTFPPFCYLLKLNCSRSTQKAAIKAADSCMELLLKARLKVELLGPTPAFYEKNRSKYNWQIIAKAKDRIELIKVISKLPSGWTYDIDPVNLL